MGEGDTCTWCEGAGEVYPDQPFGGTCGWCDGTGIQKPSYLGCEGCSGEHRTVGPIRAWCHDCREWCYPEYPCIGGE